MKTGEIIDRLREKIRLKHYSLATEKTYIGWARRYISFHAARIKVNIAAPLSKSAGLRQNGDK